MDELKHDLSQNVMAGLEGCDASGEELSAMTDLKKALAAEAGEETTQEGVGWFAVWNGDVERMVDEDEEEDETESKSVQSDDSVVTQVRISSIIS